VVEGEVAAVEGTNNRLRSPQATAFRSLTYKAVIGDNTCGWNPPADGIFVGHRHAREDGRRVIRGNGRLSLITSPRAPAIRNRCSASPGVAAEVEVRGDLDAHEIFLLTGGLRFLTVDWLVRRWPVWPASAAVRG
jgi:hypothetical protein